MAVVLDITDGDADVIARALRFAVPHEEGGSGTESFDPDDYRLILDVAEQIENGA